MKNLFRLLVILPVFFSGCTKMSTGNNSVVLAVYTIGTGINCTAASISGRYVADTALTSSNTVSITVDVKIVGPFWIATNMVNGISFSQISTFTTTGLQTVVLNGSGTPDSIGASVFTLKALNGLGDSCTFDLTTVAGIPPVYYQTAFLNGIFDNFSDSAAASNGSIPGSSGVAGLELTGIDSLASPHTIIDFGIVSTGAIGPGTYSDTSDAKAYFNYVDSLGQTWTADSVSNSSFTIVVTFASPTNVQGTFSGMIKNQLGTDSITVTSGMFSVPVQ